MPKRKADSEELQGRVRPPPAVRRSTRLANLQCQAPIQPIHVASKDDRRMTSPSGTRDLLSLPREIRDKIWSEVLGDRTIHLRYTEEFTRIYARPPFETRTPAQWKHDICVADLSEQAIYQQSIQDEEGIWRQDCDKHHGKCENKASTLDLRLLRTNHQIHKEASVILLRTNLFSINDEKSFVYFI